MNLAVAALDWLHLGRHVVAPPSLAAGMPLSNVQWRSVRVLQRLVDGSNLSLFWSPRTLAELRRSLRSKMKYSDAYIVWQCLLRKSFVDTGQGLPNLAVMMQNGPRSRMTWLRLAAQASLSAGWLELFGAKR